MMTYAGRDAYAELPGVVRYMVDWSGEHGWDPSPIVQYMRDEGESDGLMYRRLVPPRPNRHQMPSDSRPISVETFQCLSRTNHHLDHLW